MKNKFAVNIIQKKFLCLMLFFMIIFTFFSSVYASDEPVISAGSAILIENSTSNTVFDKNSNEHLEPASITKIMTAILTIENANNLNDIVTVPADAVSSIPDGYSIAGLLPNEQLSVDELLQVLMVHSANDAANVLAFYIDGSIEKFADRMNSKLSELGLLDSHFTNPSGMHDPNHYSSAHDLAFLMQYCIKNSTFRKYSGLDSCKISATNLSAERYFENTNYMMSSNSEFYYPYITCTKTGFTSQAKYCLVSVAERDDLTYICVVLAVDNSDTRFAETKTLLEYGFSNFSFKNIANKNDVVTQITISNGTDETKNLDLLLENSVNAFVNNDFSIDSVSPQILLENLPSAPIAKNKVLGTATYVINGKNYVVNLLASHDVEFSASKTYFLQVCILVIAIIVLIALLIFLSFKKSDSSELKN